VKWACWDRRRWTRSWSWCQSRDRTFCTQHERSTLQPLSSADEQTGNHRPPRRSLENTVDDIGVPKYEPKSVRTRGETHPGRYPLPGSTRGHIPNGSSIGSCVLAQLTFVTDRETRKHTSYICSNRPHICAPFRHFEPSSHPLTVCSRTSSLLDTFAVRGPNHVIQTSK